MIMQKFEYQSTKVQGTVMNFSLICYEFFSYMFEYLCLLSVQNDELGIQVCSTWMDFRSMDTKMEGDWL